MRRNVWQDAQHGLEKLLAQPDPDNAEGVLERLSALQEEFDRLDGRKDNAVAGFNDLYRIVTADVVDRLSLEPADGGFQDRVFLDRLDVEFAKMYLAAMRLWTSGESTLPRSWSMLFERWNDRAVERLHGGVMGVNAHVNHDLAHAVVRTFRALDDPEGPAEGARFDDYLLINTIFHEQIPVIRRGMTAENLYQRLFDRLNGPLDDIVQRQLVNGARAAAWVSAQRLWAARDQPVVWGEECERLERTSSWLARALLEPPLTWLLDT